MTAASQMTSIFFRPQDATGKGTTWLGVRAVYDAVGGRTLTATLIDGK